MATISSFLSKPLFPLATISAKPEITSTSSSISFPSALPALPIRRFSAVPCAAAAPPVSTSRDERVRQVHSIEEFDAALRAADNKLVVVEFAASHSRHSRQIYPFMAELSRTCADVDFLLVMGDESDATRELCRREKIDKVPHFSFYKAMEKVHEEEGIGPDELVGDVLYYGDSHSAVLQLHSRGEVERLIRDPAGVGKLVVLDAGLKHCGPCVKVYPTVGDVLYSSSLKNPNNFHWNVIIRGYSNSGKHEEAISFYNQMLHAGYLADNFTFPSVIKSCTKLQSSSLGLKIHGQLFKLGLASDLYICNSLIAMYSKLGLLNSAEKVFVEMSSRKVVSWNVMIDGYASNGEGLKSLSLFRSMQEDFGVKPDELGVMSAIDACCKLFLPKKGKELHCYITRRCFESQIKVVTTLLDLYCNCGENEMIYAERLFDMIPKKNVVVCNVMLNGYFLNNLPEKAIASLMKMQEAGIEPDGITMVNLLPSLTQLRNSSHGKSVHGIAMRKGLLPHLVLETALISMYAKTGDLRSSKLSFDMMLEKSLVSWNVMISACVQNGKSMEALKLFSLLLMEEPLLKPDVFTISSVIPAYSQLASLQHGKQIHGFYWCSSCRGTYMHA